MASALDKVRRRNNKDANGRPEWSQTGSFVHKPVKGWLHPDEQLLPDAGVCYGVRYIGCMVVKHAMKALDFDTRTAIAKESISQVCDAAGLKTASKKSKRATKVAKYLGDSPGMVFAGSNVNLTITTESITMIIMESGETIGDHQMPGVSFASGGDPDTMDFVAYVAKDAINGRACYVLECGGGLAQDVITTIGQAFELRFKQFLAQRPEAVPLPDRLENPVFAGSADAWGNDDEYYNDRPGAMPPSPTQSPTLYATPKSNAAIEGAYNSVKDPNLLGSEFGLNPYDNSQGAAVGNLEGTVYDNQRSMVNGVGTIVSHTDGVDYDNGIDGAAAAPVTPRSPAGGNLDVFDMTPFSSNLPAYNPADTSPQGAAGGASTETFLEDEKWFHGKISRQQCEVLLTEDGDFLVRESSNSAGQYVLSGRQAGRVKHLLLVDPEGIVRTKDRTFDSVAHLIAYHLSEAVPITSNDSELLLRRPVNKFG